VRASVRRVGELLGWAERFDARIWAVEGAGGVGYLLAQQLVAAGERVWDVPATLAARVRVLGSGRSNKTDANDGYSIAVAARHAPKLHHVALADHAGVLQLWAKRNKELGSARTRTACRLHALLVELVPEGVRSFVYEALQLRQAELASGGSVCDGRDPPGAARRAAR
jgi:hypothetical protein